jgi:hypothetical protein
LFLLIDVSRKGEAKVHLPIRIAMCPRSRLGFNACGLPEMALDRGASAGDQLEYQCDQSQHQQYVDKSTHGVATDHSQQPENKQNYK